MLALAFGIGIAGLFLVKADPFELFDDAMHSPFVAAAWMAAVLVGYAVVAFAKGRSGTDPITVGDNCYYLGFVFTLTSLAITLYQVAFLRDDKLLENIISGFGVALSSTIFGICLRVLFAQQNVDSSDFEREARSALYASLKDFRHSLSSATTQLKQFITESIQQAQERDQKIADIGTEIFRAQADKIEQIRVATDEAYKRHQEILVSVGMLLEDFSEVMQSMTAPIGRESVEAIGTEVNDNIKQVISSIESLDSRLAKQRSREAAEFVRLGDQLKSLSDGVSSASKEIQSTIAELPKRLRHVEGQGQGTIEQASRQLQQSALEFKRASDILAHLVAELVVRTSTTEELDLAQAAADGNPQPFTQPESRQAISAILPPDDAPAGPFHASGLSETDPRSGASKVDEPYPSPARINRRPPNAVGRLILRLL